MLVRLFLLFTVVPAVELIILIRIGGMIGAGTTLAVIILTGVVGAWLARQEGTRVWFRIQQKLNQGQLPGTQMVEGLLILVSGLLLVTPGFLTDIFGFSMLVPPIRKVAALWLKKQFEGSVKFQAGSMGPIHPHEPPDSRKAPGPNVKYYDPNEDVRRRQ